MTISITLHWWAVPAVLLLLALVMYVSGWRRRGGMFDGLGECMTAVFLALLALAVCLGHWL